MLSEVWGTGKASTFFKWNVHVQPPSRLDLGSPKMVRLVLGLKVGRSVWTSFITLVCQIHWKVLRFCAGFCWGSLSRIYTNYNEHASCSDFKDSKCLRGLQEEQSFGVQGRWLLYWLLLLYWSRIGGCRPYWLYWRVLKGCRGCIEVYWCVCVYWGVLGQTSHIRCCLCVPWLVSHRSPPLYIQTQIYQYKYQWKYKYKLNNIYTNTQLQISRQIQRLSWGT